MANSSCIQYDSGHAVCNRAPGGCRLRDVVHGCMKWVLASNYMVDMTWLLSACPHLLQAHQLVIVHGERTPDRHEPCPLTCYNTCSLTQRKTSSTICLQREATWQAALTKTMASAVAVEMRLTNKAGLSVRMFGPSCGHSKVCQQPPSCSIQHASISVCHLMLKSTAAGHACPSVCKRPCSCRVSVACLTPASNLISQNSICLPYIPLSCELNLHAMAHCVSTLPILRQQHE